MENKQYADIYKSHVAGIPDISIIKDAHWKAILRNIRDKKLNECDAIHCNAEKWEAMTEAQKTAWKNYKQALRDLPAKTKNIKMPVLPEMPE